MSIRVETKNITPEMAELWLTKNKRNRNINRQRVKTYADEMRGGKWLTHHQGIAFYEDGTLADGQHRLMAICESGETVSMVIAWGVPNNSGLMIDGHQPRHIHQAIKISGMADWIGKAHVSIARYMVQIEHNSKTCVPISNDRLVAFCEKHRAAINFSVSYLSNHKRHVTTASLKAAVSCAFYYENSARLVEFCEVIISGMAKSDNDKAAILIREWLLECGSLSMGTGQRLDACKRTMRAIKAFCENQKIKKLYQPSEFIYTPPK